MSMNSRVGHIPEYFGSMVFNDAVMKERLPKEAYRSLKRTMELGKKLDPSAASIIANAMKDWAIEKGATHFTHWFQPLTGVTAETVSYTHLDVYKRQSSGRESESTT